MKFSRKNFENWRFWNILEFFSQKKIFFCFIPMKISHKLCNRMDGTQFWCFLWFPANFLLWYYVIQCKSNSIECRSRWRSNQVLLTLNANQSFFIAFGFFSKYFVTRKNKFVKYVIECTVGGVRLSKVQFWTT